METLYTTHIHTTNGRNGHAKSADGRLDISLSHPVVQPRPAMGTDPEQLFGAAYAACFGGACAFAAKLLELTLSDDPIVNSTTTLGKRPDGGFTVRIALDVTLPGLTDADAAKVVEKAHTICPYSDVVKREVFTTTSKGTL
jgi:osmotically inducible protein OsmC